MESEVNRRPIATRGAGWAKALASFLVRAGVTPNQVSVCSVSFAIVGAAFFFIAEHVDGLKAMLCFIGAACCIQLRLICNLIDGMIAIEGRKQTSVGALYNEMPDRAADSLFLIFAGYAASAGQTGLILGWSAALLAVLTAYIRVFGAAEGLKSDFCGPMAKQHRMAVLTICSVLAAGEALLHYPPRVIVVGLVVIVIGATATCIRRVRRIATALENRPS